MQHFLLVLLNLLLCSLIAATRSPIIVSIPQKRNAKLKSISSVRIQPHNHLSVLAQQMKEASQQHLRALSSEALSRATSITRSITSSPSFPHYIAGIAAGILECLVGHPLDTIRVRIITAGTGDYHYHPHTRDWHFHHTLTMMGTYLSYIDIYHPFQYVVNTLLTLLSLTATTLLLLVLALQEDQERGLECYDNYAMFLQSRMVAKGFISCKGYDHSTVVPRVNCSPRLWQVMGHLSCHQIVPTQSIHILHKNTLNIHSL